jgi:hypothetical protein
MMATVKVNLPEIVAGGDNAAGQVSRPPAGWSVFLCDEKGNLSSPAGKDYRPFLAANGFVEIGDVPPDRRLLFARK